MNATIVIVPGYTNSSAGHWQSLIEQKYPNAVRVMQKNWDRPVREDWIAGLNETINALEGDIVLVGHSCGAIAVAQWSAQYTNQQIKGALLVAPADVDSDKALLEIQVQRPLPQTKIPYPSIVVCSDNDEHISLDKGRALATVWGSEFVLIPNGGHINADAGFGEWPQGEALIKKLASGLQ